MADTDHLTLTNDELPMPSTAEGILSVLRTVLNKPYVQSVVLSQGSPIKVSWYRDLSDSLHIREPEESVDSVLSRIDLKEISGDLEPKELIIDGMLKVSLSGEFPSHLLVGNIDTFRDFLGIPSLVDFPPFEGTDYLNFIGMPLIEVPGIHKDTIVLLSASVRDAALSEVKSGYKLSL